MEVAGHTTPRWCHSGGALSFKAGLEGEINVSQKKKLLTEQREESSGVRVEKRGEGEKQGWRGRFGRNNG